MGAQALAGVERRLDTPMQLGELHGKDKGSAREPAAPERQRGAWGGPGPSFLDWTGAKEAASFFLVDERTAASLVEASRRQGGKAGYIRVQAATNQSYALILSPNSRWVLNRKAGSGEVERETRQPRARQRPLRCEAPSVTRAMMCGLGLHPSTSLCVENGPTAPLLERSPAAM